MAAGAHFVIAPARDGPGAPDVEPGPRVAVLISDDRNALAQVLQRARFFQDTHVTAVVGKKAGGRDHQHAVTARLHAGLPHPLRRNWSLAVHGEYGAAPTAPDRRPCPDGARPDGRLWNYRNSRIIVHSRGLGKLQSFLGQELREYPVTEQPAFSRQPHARGQALDQAARCERGQLFTESLVKADAEARAEAGLADSLQHQAQAEHHRLSHLQAAPHRLLTGYRRLARVDALDVLGHRAYIPPAPIARVAMRARAESQVGFIAPIDQVVPALV